MAMGKKGVKMDLGERKMKMVDKLVRDALKTTIRVVISNVSIVRKLICHTPLCTLT